MAGTYPNLDAADLEARVRTYLNESTAGFYTQAEIWRWLSVAAKDIAQKTLCVRRVLDALTTDSARTVNTNAYKVLHVEYIPTSGRSVMLTKIDPLRVGHYPGVTVGTEGAPLYWYEFGSTIGLDPIPDVSTYKLRLYVADLPKMCSAYNGIAFVEGAAANEWTDGATAWTLSTTATHAGAGPTTLTANTALAAANTNVTFVFTVDSIGATGSITPSCGATGIAVTTAGVHMQTLAATTPWKPVLTGANDVVISNFYAYVEADYAAVGNQTELPTAWQHLLALYATYGGLTKDRKYGPAQMLESIYNNELAYLRQNVIEIVPDGRGSLKYQ
uniref:Uncharacterized protein n=1 Tax=viral metagenome TaxID=1070528 RepID=A0A6M3K968_9ZZZZ